METIADVVIVAVVVVAVMNFYYVYSYSCVVSQSVSQERWNDVYNSINICSLETYSMLNRINKYKIIIIFYKTSAKIIIIIIYCIAVCSNVDVR